MRLPWRSRHGRSTSDKPDDPPPPQATPVQLDPVSVAGCSICGRTDLPLVGGWDPPICEECDAQINFDAEEAEIALHE